MMLIHSMLTCCDRELDMLLKTSKIRLLFDVNKFSCLARESDLTGSSAHHSCPPLFSTFSRQNSSSNLSISNSSRCRQSCWAKVERGHWLVARL